MIGMGSGPVSVAWRLSCTVCGMSPFFPTSAMHTHSMGHAWDVQKVQVTLAYGCTIGGRYVTASVYQMLRGAEILFSAIFAVAFLHRSLNRLHYGGIACCLVGITLVGASTLLGSSQSSEEDSSPSASPGQVFMGMALIVIAQVRSLRLSCTKTDIHVLYWPK